MKHILFPSPHNFSLPFWPFLHIILHFTVAKKLHFFFSICCKWGWSWIKKGVYSTSTLCTNLNQMKCLEEKTLSTCCDESNTQTQHTGLGMGQRNEEILTFFRWTELLLFGKSTYARWKKNMVKNCVWTVNDELNHLFPPNAHLSFYLQ